MEFVKLEQEQRESFERDGFLVVRNVLPPNRVNELVAACDRLAASFLDEDENHYLDMRPGILHEESLRGLISDTPAVPLVAQLLGANIHLHSAALIIKKPEPANTPARRGWHRDIRMPRDCGHEKLPMVGIKICYCLTDFPQPQSGMTLMARGSHLRTEPLRVRKGEADPVDGEICDLQGHAGDAILFENRTFHTKAPNLSNRTSKVLMYGYAYRWMKPEFYLDVPDERFFEGADPITRQFLGFYRDIDQKPKALAEWFAKHGARSRSAPWTVEV